MANDDRSGEWACDSSSSTEDDTTNFQSANFGSIGTTQWEASLTVDSDDASISGTIVIYVSDEERCYITTIYHHTDEGDFRADVETLEEGNLPSDEPQQDPPEEASEVSEKKEPRGLKKFLKRIGNFFWIRQR